MYLHTEYQVVINLHHEGVVISSRETKGGSCTVWNTSFLFDLPPGDIRQLHLMLEFIIMQVKIKEEEEALEPHNQRIDCICLYCDYPVDFYIPAPLLCDRIRSFPKVKFLVESESVQRLQMLDVLTGGTCATCSWSRHAGTLCNQSLYRAPTQWT